MHLIIDGYTSDAEILADEQFIGKFLHGYPSKIGMTVIRAPQVSKCIGAKPEDWGISGYVLITESHISVHTFPEHLYVCIDIFSSKEFDCEQAIRDLKEEFKLTKFWPHILKRGIEHPAVAEEVSLSGFIDA